MESRGEAANEKADRQWRRWASFLSDCGIRGDDKLDKISRDSERLLLARSFTLTLRSSEFDQQGRVIGQRPRPMVSASIRDAIGSVALTLRKCGRSSPFHVQNGITIAGSIHPRIRALLRGFEKEDPPTKKQKAVTSQLLLDMHEQAKSDIDEWQEQIADLIIGSYFFAMRACEFCRTEIPGRTNMVRVRDISFRDNKNRLIRARDEERLLNEAQFVSVLFTDQKNGNKDGVTIPPKIRKGDTMSSESLVQSGHQTVQGVWQKPTD